MNKLRWLMKNKFIAGYAVVMVLIAMIGGVAFWHSITWLWITALIVLGLNAIAIWFMVKLTHT